MRGISRISVVVLCVAVVAAGVASGDPPPWSGKKKPGQRDSWSVKGYTRPTLVGRAGSDHRGSRYLDVRGHDATYVVDVTGAKIEGARRGKIQRGDRVLVWGRLIGRNALAANRIQVLGDTDKIPCSECGHTDCLHSDRYDYDPRHDRPRPTDEEFDERSRHSLDGRVVRASSRLTHRDITVTSLGTEWKVEVPTEAFIMRAGERLSVHDIREGEYVRARGERLANRRFRADRIEVDPRTTDSLWPGSRPDEQGSYRGSIRNVDHRGSTFGLRLSFFEVCSVHVTRETRITRDGRTLRLRDLREDDRVRVYGRLDPDSRVVEARLVEVL